MGVPTSPNPVYGQRKGARRGFVEPSAWEAALAKVGATASPASKEAARSLFNKVRKAYWSERVRLAIAGEFNQYNTARMRVGKPPIGPDGFPIELEHRLELSKYPDRALDPMNIWELFKRQHDFQHGYAFRWHMGSFPESPHFKTLSRVFGDPLHYPQWP